MRHRIRAPDNLNAITWILPVGGGQAVRVEDVEHHMKRIVILTGSELRHRFFRKAMALSPGIEVAATYCEGLNANLRDLTERKGSTATLELEHLDARDRSEEDFFGTFDRLAPDHSNPVAIERGTLNEPEHHAAIASLAPEMIVSYGCSIVRDPLLSEFRGRFVNIHLGLSPYYRGSGTNFWPLVNGEPEYVGVTFMHIDAGIDTGAIIHQIRPRIFRGDGPHQIGNRLISDMTPVCADLVRAFETLGPVGPEPDVDNDRYYRKKDFSEEATRRLYENFGGGMVETYLDELDARCARVPILENPGVAEGHASR